MGWVGIDPTNNHLVDEQFVKVAIGRDFTDVPPNKGIYRGKARSRSWCGVETRPLEEMPSLAWQEQLPPLQTPLTAIINVRNSSGEFHEDMPEQQQQ